MKAKLGPIALIYPIPIALAGANVKGRANFATIGDCGIMGLKPPLVYISLHKDHFTTRGVIENHAFSINFPTTDMMALVDYCGIVSGRQIDKSTLFKIFYGELGSVPMIEECRVNLECQVVKGFLIEHRQILIGRVVQVYADEAFVEEQDGRRMIAGLQQLDPIIYALDNRYYRIGESIGVGYQEGRSISHDPIDASRHDDD
jgi:flavin reductase (DIM6/NTAB) family NADH-FMN oxidoreductase RutF